MKQIESNSPSIKAETLQEHFPHILKLFYYLRWVSCETMLISVVFSKNKKTHENHWCPLFVQASLLGGVLSVLAGILCLVSVSWSAAATVLAYNDPLVIAALKREVGSSIYIGWAASVLLLLGGALICFICGEKERTPPPYYSYMPYSTNIQFSDASSRMATLRSEAMRSNNSRMFDRQSPRKMVEHVAQVHDYTSPSKAQSWSGRYNQPQGTPPGEFGQ